MDSLAHERSGPAEAAEAEELAARLRAALARLPARQAEVFALRFFEQMDNREIAEALALSANAVGVLLHKARRRLRELLDEPDRGRASQ